MKILRNPIKINQTVTKSRVRRPCIEGGIDAIMTKPTVLVYLQAVVYVQLSACGHCTLRLLADVSRLPTDPDLGGGGGSRWRGP